MTQAALAELTELSISYISCIERAKKKSSLEALVRISNVLDTTVDCLLSRNQKKTSVSLTVKWFELLADCTPEEKIHIYNTALALKNSFHQS